MIHLIESFQSKQHFVENDSGKLGYLQTGNGKETLITFHGFGQNGGDFQSFNTFSSRFTIYHFDLPHHGKSNWKKPIVEKEDLRQLFEQFLDRHCIDRFSIAAFSLGASVLFTLLETFPEKIDKVILIAPDGIKVNIWYKLVTRYSFFKMLFRSMVKKPNINFAIIETLEKIGLTNKSISKFVKVHMSSPEKRDKVYLIWTSFKKINTDKQSILNLLNNHGIRTILCLWNYDRLMPPSKFNSFIKEVENRKLICLETGHNQVD